ncbi:NADPH oxidase 4-like [Homarus americanus]|uniref:NADPH oxidase 4-like n=1 Tax=Homarus americanus TaxID=6706 RepID=UPI001C460707|nr:NADPH oxidase 4-like [Homarus americanus]
MAWTAACSGVFYGDYMKYKREPQYFYTRRMLGVGLCVSRGSAAVLNLSCCMLVMPMCRALTTALTSALATVTHRNPHRRPPALPAALAAPATHAAKSTHLLVAATLVISTVVHTGAHISNAVNFSRHYSSLYPDLNVATYRGESPLWIFVTTVPGVTGVLMIVVLAVLVVTSTRWARRRNYDIFFYTHHLGLLFLLLLIIHPITGVLKEQKNLHGHIPGCQVYADSHTNQEGSPGVGSVRGQVSPDSKLTIPEHLEHNSQKTAVHSETTYLEPDSDYGFPEPDSDYGFPEPDSDYGFPEHDSDYGFPEPDSDYGFPEPDSDYGFSEPDSDYGFPEPDSDNGFPESDSEYGFPEPDSDYGFTQSDSDYGFLEHHENYVPRESDSSFSLSGPKVNRHYSMNKEVSEAVDGSEAGHEGVKRSLGWKKRRNCLKAPVFGSITSQTWVWVMVALTVWGADWAVRCWRRRESVEVVGVTYHPCDVVQLTLRQCGFSCTPGQYVLVQCPTVSRFEWHPFTVTSPPIQHSPDTFTIFMRVRGDWSGRVAALLRSDGESSPLSQAVHWPVNDSLCPESTIHSSQGTLSSPLIQSSPLSYYHSTSRASIAPHRHLCTNPVFVHPSQCAPTYSSMPTVEEFKACSFSSIDCNIKRNNYLERKSISTTSTSESNGHSDYNKVNLSSSNSHLPLLRTSQHSLMVQSRRLHPYSKNSHLQHNRYSKYLKSHPHCLSLDVHSEPSTHHALNTHLSNSQPVTHTSSFINTNSDSGTKGSFQSECQGSAADKTHHIIQVTTPSYVRLRVDGPFSSPSEDMLRYPVVVGAAGGVGITPLAATLSHILWCESLLPERVHVIWVVRDARLLLALAPLLSSLLLRCWDAHTEDRLELRLHVTTPTSSEFLKELFAEEHPGLLPRITQGRPVWKHLFREWQQAYVGNKVGVFACGPARMCRQVKKHCLFSISRGAPFQYHQESFS